MDLSPSTVDLPNAMESAPFTTEPLPIAIERRAVSPVLASSPIAIEDSALSPVDASLPTAMEFLIPAREFVPMAMASASASALPCCNNNAAASCSSQARRAAFNAFSFSPAVVVKVASSPSNCAFTVS